MKYYIDCEFDGLGGELISMGIVSETDRSLYAVMNYTAKDPWVLENVVPLVYKVPPEKVDFMGFGLAPLALAKMLGAYFTADPYPHIIADWPDDIKYFCQAVITGPGTMIDTLGLKMSVKRVDAYPTSLPGAVPHNAWWDAQALRHFFRLYKSED